MEVINSLSAEAAAALAIVSMLLSLLLEYAPRVSDWYEKLSPRYKPTVIAGLLALVVFGPLALSCFNLSQAYVCDVENGFVEAFLLYLASLVVNQTTHKMTKREIVQSG